MVKAVVQQVSFNGGELSDSLYGRTDLEKYDTSVRTMTNFIPTLQGNVLNRPGTEFVVETKDSSKESRLIPFQFNVSQTYILEFGDLYMRVITDGAQVVYPVGHVDAGDPVEVITPYLEADLNRIQFAQSADVLFMVHPSYPPQEVKRFSNSEWTVSDIAFGASSATPTTVASSAAGTSFYYKVTSITDGEESIPSAAAGSSTQTSVISWDTIFGASNYNIYKLENGIYNWIGESGTTAFTDATLAGDASKRPPEANNPFDDDSVVENIGSNLIPAQTYIDGLTSSGGGWSTVATNYYGIAIYSVDKMFNGAGANNGYLTNNTGIATVTVTPDAPVVVGAYSIEGGRLYPETAKSWTFEGYDGAIWVLLDTRESEVSWTKNEKRIYTFVNEVAYEDYRINILGTNGVAYSVIGEMELYTATYSTAANYPGSVNIYQQRLLFARTDALPQTIFGSQTGNFYNFNISNPLQDDDAYEFTVASNQVNAIQWMSAIKSMLIGSSGSEWEMSGGSNGGAITPTSINLSPQGNRGSEPIMPIIIGSSLLYVARGANKVRDYGYSFDIDGYNGDDITVLASDLFEDVEIIAWAFQRNPYSVVWVVTTDGKMLGLTYDKAQKVVAWHKHETDGLFESVASIPGDI